MFSVVLLKRVLYPSKLVNLNIHSPSSNDGSMSKEKLSLVLLTYKNYCLLRVCLGSLSRCTSVIERNKRSVMSFSEKGFNLLYKFIFLFENY